MNFQTFAGLVAFGSVSIFAAQSVAAQHDPGEPYAVDVCRDQRGIADVDHGNVIPGHAFTIKVLCREGGEKTIVIR